MGSTKMRLILVLLPMLYLPEDTKGYFPTIECPPYSQTEILQSDEFNFQPLDCTLVMSCRDPFRVASNAAIGPSHCPEDKFHDSNFLFDCFPESTGSTCEMKLKVTLIRNWDLEALEESPCAGVHKSSAANLLPFPGNCSLFYKCDWGSAVLFECPPHLHFNPQLQVCDWPWQAQCDASWSGCPRPYPRCPSNYQRPVYLPHPHLCDHFYQCEWGTPRIQTCPTGLHFNAALKICDWPYKAHCRVC